MKVITWNMNQKRAPQNWKLLQQGQQLECDIALLNEATRPPDAIRLTVQTNGRTVGRDDREVGGNKVRNWATAIATPHQITPARGDLSSPVVASRPGSWEAAVATLPDGRTLTAISLYGLLDERSDASVHRSLSDLTPILEHERYNKRLILGGDLNTLCIHERGSPRLARDMSVIERIQAFGLVDVLRAGLDRQEPRRGGLEGCPCHFGEDCWHTRTFRDSKAPDVPYQDDYLYASRSLAERLVECSVPAFTDDWPSDHVPIVATFK